MCLLPPRDEPSDPTMFAAAAPVDSEWVNARLSWTGAVAPGLQPTAAEWRAFWAQARAVPPNAWWELKRVRRPLWLTCREPLTTLPFLSDLAGIPVAKYPDGSGWTYDQLPGLGDPSIRIDWLGRAGGVALVPHEAAHALDLYVLGLPSAQPEWMELHRTHTWWDPYTTAYPDEAWAESFAVFTTGLKPLAARVKDYFGRLFRSRNWGPWDPGV